MTDACALPAELAVDQFAAWVAPATAPMTRLAMRLAPHADPRDIVQDAFEQAWRKRHLYEAERGTPTTWLLAITADTTRADRRRRARWARIVDDHADPPEPAFQAQPATPDHDLDEAIRQLTDRQELAIHCHYFLDLPITDTALVMGCSPGTVKSTLHDARARLRVLLEMTNDH